MLICFFQYDYLLKDVWPSQRIVPCVNTHLQSRRLLYSLVCLIITFGPPDTGSRIKGRYWETYAEFPSSVLLLCRIIWWHLVTNMACCFLVKREIITHVHGAQDFEPTSNQQTSALLCAPYLRGSAALVAALPNPWYHFFVMVFDLIKIIVHRHWYLIISTLLINA